MSNRRKYTAVEQISMTFLEHGRVLKEGEYRHLTGAPVRFKQILHLFGSYPRMLRFMQFNLPHVWEELQNPPPPPPPEPEPEVVEDPLEALANATAVESEDE